MKKTTEIFVDHMNETIYVTANFMRQAGLWGTSEYECFKALKNENPSYKIERRSVSSNKRVYKGLTLERMRKYIEFKEGGESEAMKEFEKACTEAKIRGHAYPRTKSCFVHMYKDYASDPVWENVARDNTPSGDENTAA